MTPTAVDRDLEAVGTRHDGPAAGRDQAVAQIGGDMDSEGAVDAVEHTFFDHVSGAVITLFAGLKHEAHLAGEFILVIGQ